MESSDGGLSLAKEEEAHGQLPQTFPRGNLLLEYGLLEAMLRVHGATTSVAGGGISSAAAAA
jgi:hypothetical protein